MIDILWLLLQIFIFIGVVGLLAWLARAALREFGGEMPAIVVKVLNFLIIALVVVAVIYLLLSIGGYMPRPFLRPL